jgi:hypothetical protein
MPLRATDFESAAYAIPPLRVGGQCTAADPRIDVRGNRMARHAVFAETDARLARPQNRRPEGSPDRGGPSLDDGPR